MTTILGLYGFLQTEWGRSDYWSFPRMSRLSSAASAAGLSVEFPEFAVDFNLGDRRSVRKIVSRWPDAAAFLGLSAGGEAAIWCGLETGRPYVAHSVTEWPRRRAIPTSPGLFIASSKDVLCGASTVATFERFRDAGAPVELLTQEDTRPDRFRGLRRKLYRHCWLPKINGAVMDWLRRQGVHGGAPVA